jgi:hypothetical protein
MAEAPAPATTMTQPAEPSAYRPAGRGEERSPGLFERVKGFAFGSGTGGGAHERQAPRLSDRSGRPVANSHASFSGALDEIGDIPSFLRRERVEG